MRNYNYRIRRENIYVGKVVRTIDSIYRNKGDMVFRIKPGQLLTSCWRPYRSMLFVPNEEKLSNDLLYQSPSYPILNITDDETCLKLEEKSIVIKDACNLEALLEYFGYNEDLTYEDIIRIRKIFFTGRYAKDNCELFGFKEIKPEDYTYYKESIKVTDPRELKRLIEQERRSQQEGHRSFHGISESVLPSEYFDALDTLGDNTLLEAIQLHEKMDAFAPHKEEGMIKKLTRF